MTDVYMTTEGGKDTTLAVRESPVSLGVRTGYEPHDDEGVHFLDFPFTDPDATFVDHLAECIRWEPEVAVAPDIEKGRELGDVIDKADMLAEYADTVVIVPKSIHPDRVPDRFRVGFPASDYGSGHPWSVWDFSGCDSVHILGGGYSRQLKYQDYLAVESVDTATLGKRCRFGTFHVRRGSVNDVPDGWDYRRRLRYALHHYHMAWNPDVRAEKDIQEPPQA